MGDCVLDASALLATLQDEPGGADVEGRLNDACMGAVNLSEVIAGLSDRGMPMDAIARVIAALNLDVRPFDQALAERAGFLRLATREKGLSLGDRACLALAEQLAVPAVTADKAWAELDIGIEIALIR